MFPGGRLAGNLDLLPPPSIITITFDSQIIIPLLCSLLHLLPPCSVGSAQQATMSGRGKGKSAKKSVSQSSKAGLQFPVGRVAR